MEFQDTTIMNKIELSIVMPCLNEAATIGKCINKAKRFIHNNNISAEIIVADNGSIDGSREIASAEGAKVVRINKRGYGSALIGGIAAAKGEFIIMGDSDDSYDFLNLMPLLNELRNGYDLVIGNRFKAGISPKSMPFLHKYIGNPILSGIGKLFFGSNIGDFHCGLRGFTKSAFELMNLKTSGMEFASEMIVKSTLYKLKITEVPIKLYPDGREGKSHLRSFRDGWRHLRFLLLYSPRWLFLYPGIFLIMIGIIASIFIFFNPKPTPDIHSLLYSVGSIMIGFQAVIFAVFTKTFAVHEELIPMNPFIENIFKKSTLEVILIIGGIMLLIGLLGAGYSYYIWREGTFFHLSITKTMRIVIASFTLIVLGLQIIFSGFFYSILKLEVRSKE